MTDKEHDAAYAEMAAMEEAAPGDYLMTAEDAQEEQECVQQMYHGIAGTTIPAHSNSNAWTLTATGNIITDEEGEEVASIIRKHSKGFYYIISVNNDDDVHYQVYAGGFIKRTLFKMMGDHPHATFVPLAGGDNANWTQVRKRTHLPATIGAAHQEIDEAVAGFKEDDEHAKYAEEILKTNPENLKMIGGLEKLQEGVEEDGVDHQAPSIANVSAGQVLTLAHGAYAYDAKGNPVSGGTTTCHVPSG